MIQMATATSDGSWTRATSTGEAAASRPSGTALLSDGDQRPTTNARTDASNMSRLELSRALRDDHRDDHGDGEGQEGRVGHEGPDVEGGDRHTCEQEIGQG